MAEPTTGSIYCGNVDQDVDSAECSLSSSSSPWGGLGRRLDALPKHKWHGISQTDDVYLLSRQVEPTF